MYLLFNDILIIHQYSFKTVLQRDFLQIRIQYYQFNSLVNDSEKVRFILQSLKIKAAIGYFGIRPPNLQLLLNSKI